MSPPTDRCGLPVIGGFRLEVNGEWCWATFRPSPEGSVWVIRAPGGRVLGAGRSVAAALRIARMTLGGSE